MNTCKLILILIAGLWTSAAFAVGTPEKTKDIYDLTDIVAVQNRAFEFKESFALLTSFLPSDAFNRGFGVGGYYNYTLNDHYSWEVLRYAYIFNEATSAKDDIQNQHFALSAGNGGVLDYPVHIFTTGIVFTPLYNKGLLFNHELMYSEFSLYLGAGVAVLEQTGNRYLITPGIQGRFYLSQKYAVIGHFRDHFYIDPQQGFSNMIDIGVALEFQINLFGPRERIQ